MTVAQVLRAVERIAPPEYAYPDDRIGLQVGDASAPVERTVVALDPSVELVRWAAERGSTCIVGHHPLIYQPLRTLTPGRYPEDVVLELLARRVAYIAAHTNWDAAPGGVNDTLAGLLGLGDLRPFGQATPLSNLKLVTFVPHDAFERVVDTLAEAGAGRIGAYERCAFYHAGTGTFVGGPETRPTIGAPGVREQVEELRLEMVLPASRAEAVRAALVEAHPYEEPAYDFVVLRPAQGMGIGRVGTLPAPLPFAELVAWVDDRLATRSLAYGHAGTVQKVAVVGGAGGSLWEQALAAGADVLVAGEVAHHEGLAAAQAGFRVLAAGHWATEQPGALAMGQRLRQETGLEVLEWTPSPGLAGRPAF